MRKFTVINKLIMRCRVTTIYLFLIMVSFLLAGVNRSYAEEPYIDNENITIENGEDITLRKYAYGIYPESLHFTSILTETEGILTIKVYSLCCDKQNVLILNGTFLYPDGDTERIEMFSDIKTAPEIVNFSRKVPAGTILSFSSGFVKLTCEDFPCEYFVKVLEEDQDEDNDINDSDDDDDDGRDNDDDGRDNDDDGRDNDDDGRDNDDDGRDNDDDGRDDDDNGSDNDNDDGNGVSVSDDCSGPGFPDGHPFDGNCSRCHDDGRTSCSDNDDGSDDDNDDGSDDDSDDASNDDNGGSVSGDCTGPGFPDGHPFDGNCSRCHDDGRTSCSDNDDGSDDDNDSESDDDSDDGSNDDNGGSVSGDCSRPGFPDGHPFDGNCSQCHDDGRTSCGDNDDGNEGKSFTFNCERSMENTYISNLEKVVMSVSESENCTLALTKFKENVSVSIKHIPLGSKAAQISPIMGNTGTNGKLTFTIAAIKKGRDWISWAVSNTEGDFDFSMDAYDKGTAWGMFVEVK